jgi:oxygen-independent coproporphyrinogen-3 oxidase
MPLGLYVSVPFCRTKCSYCNFASDVSSRIIFQRYIDHICSDISRSAETAEQFDAVFDPAVDSVYFGGGTPTVLDIADIERLFVTISQNFDVQPGAEITVECAPGTLTPAILDSFQQHGVNRVSLGVQSFVDQEARSVGRLHTRAAVLDDIARLRAAGVENINIDLIAGLPYQTVASWNASISQAIDAGVPHLSIYMLEVDEDSRLGRELIAGGTRYHAHFVPDGDLIADLYEIACERLCGTGIHQYEISNFACKGYESRHNLKYWTRQPYLGFGVDAHSMLGAKPPVERDFRKPVGLSSFGPTEAVRFSTPGSLDAYLSGASMQRTRIPPASALEESFFLGLRLNRGINLSRLAASFGSDPVSVFFHVISDFVKQGLIERNGETIRLTSRGRLLSNEVFAGFLTTTECSG